MIIRKLFNKTVFIIYDDDYEYADEFEDALLEKNIAKQT